MRSSSEKGSEEFEEPLPLRQELFSPKNQEMLRIRRCEWDESPVVLCELPFTEFKRRFSFKSIHISVAIALLRSWGLFSLQLLDPSRKTIPPMNAMTIVEMPMSLRGGKDFASGTSAGSRTLTVGISLTS